MPCSVSGLPGIDVRVHEHHFSAAGACQDAYREQALPEFGETTKDQVACRARATLPQADLATILERPVAAQAAPVDLFGIIG